MPDHAYSVSLVFPHQLFRDHPALARGRTVYLVEETLYFLQYPFHKQKLVLHRASMKWYAQYLCDQGYSVNYIDCGDARCDIRILVKSLPTQSVIHCCDTADDWLTRRMSAAAKAINADLIIYPSPGFLTDPSDADAFLKNDTPYFQADFYIAQRKARNLLMQSNGRPEGGKWSYDTENRKRFPKNEVIPHVPLQKANDYITEARLYVSEKFPDNYGSIGAPFEDPETIFSSVKNSEPHPGFYACTFEDAENALQNFIDERFAGFGAYEDAMVLQASVLHHSVLSPLLNTGLLIPQQVIDAVMAGAERNNVSLPSLEGFLRQVIGWREYMRIVYDRKGTRQRTSNFWGFTRKIPAAFWKGKTDIHPVDHVIGKVLRSGYTHHIERLMVLGNFFLLCEFDPTEVYEWFMVMFIDAYDWVMVPNIYGMSQFADGGLMTTKPYFGGSHYLMKMGDWKKGPWQTTWDALFWRFVHTHRAVLVKNPRINMLITRFDNMDQKKQTALLETAERYLQTLDHGQF